MSPLKSTIVCAALLTAAGFSSMARAADVPSVQDHDPVARAATFGAVETVPAPDRQEAATVQSSTPPAQKPDLQFALRTPEERFAEAPMPMAMRAIHYDQTPNGIPANVSTLGFVQKF